MKYLVLFLCCFILVACSSIAQNPSLETQNVRYSYAIEEAYADEGWTRLERTISTGEAITFLVPSIWLPTQMSDIGSITVTVDRADKSKTLLTITQD